MNWHVAGNQELARYFEMENVWSKDWTRVADERAHVLVGEGVELNLAVWEAVFNRSTKRFAADEVSNGVWVFALPAP